MTRAYDNSTRAQKAAETAERIADATETLLANGPIREVTLQAIADGADTTVQTVMRHMGSRDGCFAAVADRVGARIAAQRGHTEPGDVQAAVAEVVAHYEAEGRLVLNLLSQEGSEALAADSAQKGRAFHRAWVERCFGVSDPEVVDALVAATDLYVWKLLRLDLGRSKSATIDTITRLIRGAMESE